MDVLFFSSHPDAFSSTIKTFGQQVGIRFSFVPDIDELPAGGRQNGVEAVLLQVPEGGAAPSLVRQIRGILPDLPVVAWLGAAGMADIVEVMQAGACDCVVSVQLDGRISTALQKSRRKQDDPAVKMPGGPSYRGLRNIIGTSAKIKEVFSLITRICDTDTTVLIQGESGTGKELIAQALHYEGVRRNGLFIPVNCGAIPAELLESELFGHEKGAFTHALNTRIGRFELANGGTVLLDEISEMSPMLQVKILRVLQERQFERIGGTRTISSDFRVIAATNRDLEELVRQGRFREDLYYRLNVIPIKAPALRERPSDILPLAEHFIERFDKGKNRKIEKIAPVAQKMLLQYGWPGNVRELENVIERMVILAAGPVIEVEDLPERIRNSKLTCRPGDAAEAFDGNFSLSNEVSAFEKKLIIQALNQTNWVKNRAAQLLNINRTTLIEKMKRYELVKPQVRMEEA